MAGEKLSVDSEEDNAINPGALSGWTCCVVVGDIPRACSLASSVDKDSWWQGSVHTTNASHVLMNWYTIEYPLITLVNFCIPIFAK